MAAHREEGGVRIDEIGHLRIGMDGGITLSPPVLQLLFIRS